MLQRILKSFADGSIDEKELKRQLDSFLGFDCGHPINKAWIKQQVAKYFYEKFTYRTIMRAVDNFKVEEPRQSDKGE